LNTTKPSLAYKFVVLVQFLATLNLISNLVMQLPMIDSIVGFEMITFLKKAKTSYNLERRSTYVTKEMMDNCTGGA
jgi:hypothetical protein